jgi:hypothetical protein
MRIMGLTMFMAAAALAGPAQGDGWRLSPAVADRPLELSLEQGGKTVYRLSCGASDVAVSEYGATKLLDVQTGKPVGDAAGSTMTPGASVMALATDKAEPRMVPASAAPNPAGGWDMTIRVAKNDPAFLSLGRAGMVSLFTTGQTQAVMLGTADRKLLADFVKQCRR